MVQGSRLLKEWRLSKELTQTDAAALVESSAAGWCGWENGSIPKLAVAFLIERATEGAVPVASWAVDEAAA
jgi:hypothetical protein